jgi:uncharacterized protein YutE (UPF0331/DUF86 family)/predicted nucleotidyltransferase
MVKGTLTLDYTLPKLRELFERLESVEIAILFGSIAREGLSAHDVDVALRLKGEDLLEVGYIITQAAGALRVSEDCIDVALLSRTNPMLLSRILEEGIIVKGRPEAIEQLSRRAQQAPDALMELKRWATLDPNPKLDKAIITSRVEEIRRDAAFIKNEILSRKAEELSYKDTLALERAMHKIAESMLDVCRHLVSAYSLGFVESYGEYPQRLAEANKMPRGLAKDVAKLAGLRNILVHRYLEVRREILHQAAKETVERIVGEFIEWMKTVDPEG